MHAGGIGYVAIVEVQVLPWKMLIVVQMVNTTPIEGTRPPDKAVHLIPLVE
jgi:hypothetical protein